MELYFVCDNIFCIKIARIPFSRWWQFLEWEHINGTSLPYKVCYYNDTNGNFRTHTFGCTVLDMGEISLCFLLPSCSAGAGARGHIRPCSGGWAPGLLSGSLLPGCVLWFWSWLLLRLHVYLTENSCPDGASVNTARPSSDLMMVSSRQPSSPRQEDNSGHLTSESMLKKGCGRACKHIKIPAEIQFERWEIMSQIHLLVISRNELFREIWLSCICIPKFQCTNYHFL